MAQQQVLLMCCYTVAIRTSSPWTLSQHLGFCEEPASNIPPAASHQLPWVGSGSGAVQRRWGAVLCSASAPALLLQLQHADTPPPPDTCCCRDATSLVVSLLPPDPDCRSVIMIVFKDEQTLCFLFLKRKIGKEVGLYDSEIVSL